MWVVILLSRTGREYYGHYLVRQWIGLVINEIVVNTVPELICYIVIFSAC